ncbi:glycoside hydrolase family 28 protein [Cercospora zeae-maydis SCOH1-5]|uniref:galacturonan 1,4-alpha-galacturonidase n=1 Tax=Cercospora zeae-maydis SCOH1-5 TaxID=717836 RepID=A0A6A6FTK1_9PEZI|nr:glycoside hydrolase family 28 protein [Cercospora zeae-maydis SCOH1-5]
MLPKTILLVLQALSVTATWTAYREYFDNLPKKLPKRPRPSPRPKIRFDGVQPYQSLPSPSRRTKTCFVESHDDLRTDDSEYIIDALNKCNHGGHVVFPRGTTYVIGTALDLTFLDHVDLDIQAYIQFTNDTDYWQAQSFKQVFQNATTFFVLGGKDVFVYGGGMLDGNGQVWYDLYAEDPLILRPIIFGTVGLESGIISDLNLRYSPQWYNFVANSTNVVFDGLTIGGYSQSAHEAKNTDGWDIYRSSNIVIQNSIINNGDDCVSFKPNSTEILVQNLYCNGSHGISVGSLGQYPGEVDIVEDIMVVNISMYNASDGARIKVWPGASAAMSVDLQGGGGLGRVNRVTYKDMYIDNVDYAVEITQCYGQKNLTLCNAFPSNLTISEIDISGIHGKTSGKYDPYTGYVVCSSPNVCSNISLADIHVVAPDGIVNRFQCGNVAENLLQNINCTELSF